ncbi:hypothetical protein MIND_00164900 [Mycena indigotica]|uniref:Magnesium transporter n=1 Tax=Mycena indigotica TaxID=2126181 RepID=A0A8H6TFS8_9AGAR|nr:uncharacterized protein MIND_00164900 [Mycena indigotica]KAF7316459.1 hypothetical protein MIND_00164900 [Mycena indigotica]
MVALNDRYVGLLLAVAASIAIGTSSVITKMGLTAAAGQGKNATDGFAYLQNPIWWGGTLALAVGEAANFAAYTFAPPVMVTPLGALSVIIGAILASVILNEKLGHLGRVGCALCILGTTIIVLHAPADADITTITQFLDYALAPGFLFYCFTATVFSLAMIFRCCAQVRAHESAGVHKHSKYCGRGISHVHQRIWHCVEAYMGGQQPVRLPKHLPIRINWADIFSVNLVNPLYYVGFCTATIVASLILFKGFNTTSPANTISLLCGFIITFLGVHILNIALLDSAVEANTQRLSGSYGRMGVGDHDEERYVRTPLFAAYDEEEQLQHEGSDEVRMHRVHASRGSRGEDIRASRAV